MRSIETTAAKLSVFKMTWPIFIEILLQMMVGNVDQFMLSHYSQKSVAAVGNANQIINIVIIALSVISMAATILIAQYRGAGNKEKVTEVCTVALLTNFIFGLIISSILFCFDNFFLDLLPYLMTSGLKPAYFYAISLVYSGPGSIHLFYFFFPRLFTAKSNDDASINHECYQYYL